MGSLVLMAGTVHRVPCRVTGFDAGTRTHEVLLTYVEKRRGEGAAAATIRYEIVVLGRMYTLALHAGLLAVKPTMPTITVRNTRTGFSKQAELARVLAALPEDLRPACRRRSQWS